MRILIKGLISTILLPIWLMAHVVSWLFSILGSVLQWVSRKVCFIALFLDVAMLIITGAVSIFIVALIVIAIAWATPYIAGFGSGLCESLCELISAYWHGSLGTEEDNEDYTTGQNKDSNSQKKNKAAFKPTSKQTSEEQKKQQVSANDKTRAEYAIAREKYIAMRRAEQNKLTSDNNANQPENDTEVGPIFHFTGKDIGLTDEECEKLINSGIQIK